MWFDRRFGTVFMGGVGFGAGLVLGMWSLIALTRAAEQSRRSTKRGAQDTIDAGDGAEP